MIALLIISISIPNKIEKEIIKTLSIKEERT